MGPHVGEFGYFSTEALLKDRLREAETLAERIRFIGTIPKCVEVPA
jgi:hypothetical protein